MMASTRNKNSLGVSRFGPISLGVFSYGSAIITSRSDLTCNLYDRRDVRNNGARRFPLIVYSGHPENMKCNRERNSAKICMLIFRRIRMWKISLS